MYSRAFPFVFVLGTLVLLSACRAVDDGPIVFPKDRYTILSVKNSEVGGVKQLTATEEEVEQAFSILHKFLRRERSIQPLNNYYVQFSGNTNEKGERIIEANYFCHVFSGVDWKNEMILVLDGGNCYFQASVNLNTGKVFDFYVNGEA